MAVDRATESGDGILIVGHGTRHALGMDEFQKFALQVAALEPTSRVRSCFLELASPTIAEGIDEMIGHGVRRLIVAPIMLFSARHVQVDIPREVAAAIANVPNIQVSIAAHLGCHEKLVELSNLRYTEAIAADSFETEDTLLVMVGRGSHDAGALAEMQQFTRLCVAGRSGIESRICYMAMAEPSLDRALDDAARLPFKRIVVQPHLLFEGVLLQRLRQRVANCRQRFPHTQWCLAERLAPHRLLAEAIVDRVGDARRHLENGSRVASAGSAISRTTHE